VAILVKPIKVVNSRAAMRLTSGPADTVITPSDTVSFQLFVRDTSGVSRVIWGYGDGKFDTTKTGSVHAVKHGYPGPSVVVVGKDSTFALTVTVIDSLGGSTTQKLSNVKVSNLVLGGNVTGATSGLVNTAYPFAVTVVPAGKKIAHAEWDLDDGQGWRAGSATIYSAKWLKPGSYTVKVRLTDKDSNAVTLTANPISITNTKSTLSITSIADPSLANPGTHDTIVTPGDEVTFTLNATDVDGIQAWLWSFGDGTPIATTATGSTKHTYPGVDVVPASTAKHCTLSVQVVDLLGDTTSFARVAVVKDTNDVPQIVSQPDTFSYITTMHTVKTSATDLGKIARYEWSADGVVFRGTLAADTIFKMSDTATSNFSAYVRAVDGDGNASKVDTIRIVTYGEMIDARDNQKYMYIKIGSQTWMAKNLNYAADSSWWYNNSADSGAKYGRLYSWASAMGLADTCNTKNCSSEMTTKHKGVCPVGWHVGDSLEWEELIAYCGGRVVAGGLLKARGGWSSDKSGAPSWVTHDPEKANGSDAYGFSAFPSGRKDERADPNPAFVEAGYTANWWSTNGHSTNAVIFYAVAGTDLAGVWGGDLKRNLSSVRCLKD
jgi:uncharacterized protein (TIGR02145 family)